MRNESAVTCATTRLRSPVVDYLCVAVLAAVAAVIGLVGWYLLLPPSSATHEVRGGFSSGFEPGATLTVQFFPAPREVVIVIPKVDPRYPLTQPQYPPGSRPPRRAATVKLNIYVLENGRVGEVRIGASCGHANLDEAAVREAKRSWRLLPGTENGKPIAMWAQFAVTFKPEDIPPQRSYPELHEAALRGVGGSGWALHGPANATPVALWM